MSKKVRNDANLAETRELPSILVVDDEPQMLSALEDILEDDYHVLTASSAKQALEIAELTPALAAILCDQRMPRMSGDKFLAKVREISRATRVMVTGYADLEAVVRAVNDGKIFAYVSKPWDPEGIKLIVHRAVEFYALSMSLEIEQSLLRDLMRSSPDAIFFKDLEARYLRMNEVEASRVGLERPEQGVGKTIADFRHPELSGRFQKEDAAVLEGGQVLRNLVHQLERGNRIEWWSTSKAPIKDGRGRVTGLVGISRDITLQKRTEQELRLVLDASTLIGSAADPSAALNELVEMICFRANWQYGEIWHKHDDGMFRVNEAAIGAFSRYDSFYQCSLDTPIRAGDGLIGRAWKQNKTIVLKDLGKANFPFLRREPALKAGLVTSCAVPIFYGGEVQAVLNFFADRARPDDLVWIGIVEAIAQHLSSVLERRELEKSVIERGNQYRVLVDQSPDGVFVHQDGVIVMSNPQADSMFGFPGGLVGKSIYDCFAPEYHDLLNRRVEYIASEQHGNGHADYECVRHDGSRFFVESRGQRLTWKGEPAIQSVVRDVSERLEAEEALQKSETRFRTLIAESAQGIVVMKDTVPLFANQKMAEIFGFESPEQFLQIESIFDLVEPAERARIETYRDERAAGRDAPNYYEVACQKADGTRIMTEWRVARVPWDDGIAACIHIIDITRQVALEKQLHQSQKLEAVGQLTGGVAHDFNNLLTVIMGNLELLSGRIDDFEDAKLSRWVNTSRRAAQRGADLTRQLLAISRRQVLEPELIEPNDLVHKVSDMLERTLGEHIEIRFVLADGLSRILTDPAQLESAILNLAINARDAMPDGGTLTIQTRETDLDNSYVEVKTDVKPGRYVEISVTDSGTGMSPEVQEKVLEPFFTTKEVGKGTGLGLSMVHSLVKQSEGHLGIYSEVGGGTTIKLYFPSKTANGADQPGAVDEDDDIAGNGVILVVEDNEDVREMAESMLEAMGYRVLTAENGPDGLAKLKDHPDIDLLFTDIVMPGGMTGIELSNQAIELRPDLSVLYTSGYAEPALQDDMRKKLESRWLAKPYTSRHLGAKIREVMERNGGSHGKKSS
ncbi:MAG: PAS domain S-box protein [Rhodospirillales bacterium]